MNRPTATPPENLPPNMLRFVSHKEVRALKIADVRYVSGTGLYVIEFEPYNSQRFDPMQARSEWVDAFGPKAGQYFVVYKDGYCSVSPSAAFEEGYTLQE